MSQAQEVLFTVEGATTFATLKKVYHKGAPYKASASEWEMLEAFTNPVTGEKVFAKLDANGVPLKSKGMSLGNVEAASVQPPVASVDAEESTDPVAQDSGDIDTGLTPSPRRVVVNKGKAIPL